MFELATARLAERIPAGDGWAAEPKFDGYRTSITRAGDAGVVIRSRRNTDLTDAFPELAAAAAEQVPADTVLDAELVASVDGRLSFDVLQHRMGMSGTRAAAAAAREPATYEQRGPKLTTGGSQ